jgi:hypothetical protein
MSDVRLNLIDAARAIHGRVDSSLAGAAVAALSAEPETIAELEVALARYIKPLEDMPAFAAFRTLGNAAPYLTHSHPDPSDMTAGPVVDVDMVDQEPWDGGVIVIDLPARIVAAEFCYPPPRNQGQVYYQDGSKATEVAILYRVSNDWLFINSLAEYQALCTERRAQRAANPPLDARSVLYGSALLEFIRDECLKAQEARSIKSIAEGSGNLDLDGRPQAQELQAESPKNPEEPEAEIEKEIATIHANWLLTPREDLRGQTPRDVLLEKREFLEFELHTRELQWSLQGEGPPGLPNDSFAFKFAGFGTHEGVIYYDLLRHLLRECWHRVTTAKALDVEMEIARLEVSRRNWLGLPEPTYGGRIPSVISERERKRIPLALSASDMIIDEDCPLCQELGKEMSMDFGPGFWHLDGSHMDDDFAFSFDRTYEEWEAERHRWQEFREEFDREWEQNQLSDGTEQPLDLELPSPGESLADRVQ